MAAGMRFIRCRHCGREDVVEGDETPPGWTNLTGWSEGTAKELWYCSPECATEDLDARGSGNGRSRPGPGP